ncbi:MAG: hypothetical protein HUK20_03205 [Fibrobacter sp.]|nr:hypothetical protein [Fibrobacter sp.]
MSRSDRRHAKQKAKNFTPKKANSLDTRIIVVIAAIAVVFFIGTMLIQRGA